MLSQDESGSAVSRSVEPDSTSPAARRRRFLVPAAVAKQIELIRAVGLKKYFRLKGKWVLLGIIAFYFVRDMTLYVIIPYLAVRGIISCN